MGSGVTRYYEATIDACSSGVDGHPAHLRRSMRWPGEREPERWLWCLGCYDQERQNRRVIVGVTDGFEELVGEGMTVVGSAYRAKREPGECGECCEPEDFDWHAWRIVNDGPVIVCHVHQALAPWWAYEVEVGLEAWRNEEVKSDG